jgi:TonB family protein
VLNTQLTTGSLNFSALRSFTAALFVLSLLTGFSPRLLAQKISTEKSEKTARKLIHRVDPIYPRDLQRLSIGGVVRLDVQITARGRVDHVSVVGGNPILADSAMKAVKQWQYEPAEAPSNLLLNIEFNPRR